MRVRWTDHLRGVLTMFTKNTPPAQEHKRRGKDQPNHKESRYGPVPTLAQLCRFMFCVRCGAALTEGLAEACPRCGHRHCPTCGDE